MARSRNSRKGSTNNHSKRHNCCGTGCPWCEKNFQIAEAKQKLKGTEDLRRVREV
jgi:hypothetical protein